MKNCTNNKNIIIQKSGKANSVAVIDRSTHNKRIKLMLSDQINFLKVDVP